MVSTLFTYEFVSYMFNLLVRSTPRRDGSEYLAQDAEIHMHILQIQKLTALLKLYVEGNLNRNK